MTIELYSIGALVVRLGMGYGTVTKAIDAMGLKPHTRIDGIPHYTEEDYRMLTQARARRLGENLRDVCNDRQSGSVGTGS